MDKRDFLQQQLELLTGRKDNYTWREINDFRTKNLGITEAIDTTRKGAKIIDEYIDEGWSILPPLESSGDDNVDLIQSDIMELRKERMKLQSEKVELNKNLRELARDELITEHIIKAIKELPKIEVPEAVNITFDNRRYLLTIADCHFGVEVKVPGLYGNIINVYSPEIFYERMELLFHKVVDTINKENITLLDIWSLGDDLHGLIRANSQLMQLRYGIVESAMIFADYFSNWLNRLSKYTKIRYQAVQHGNHGQLRLLGLPKNSFPDENMEKVIYIFMKERLKDNPNIYFVDNATGLNYAEMCSYICIGEHGERKDLKKEIHELSRIYNVPISYIFTGHLHHKQTEEIGIDSEVVRVGSIIGMDDYSMSIRSSSNASANLFVFEQMNGKIIDYTFKLN